MQLRTLTLLSLLGLGLFIMPVEHAEAAPKCPDGKIYRYTLKTCQDKGSAIRAGVYRGKRPVISKSATRATRAAARVSRYTARSVRTSRYARVAIRAEARASRISRAERRELARIARNNMLDEKAVRAEERAAQAQAQKRWMDEERERVEKLDIPQVGPLRPPGLGMQAGQSLAPFGSLRPF